MAITYNREKKIFSLHTEQSTYQIQVGPFGHLIHLYYGDKINGYADYLLTYLDRGFSGNPYEAGEDRTYSMDSLPQEYPTQGTGDYRTTCLVLKNGNGTYSCNLRYKNHSIFKGKYGIQGMPAVYASEEEADTLKIILEDEVSKVQVALYYGVIEKKDIITRCSKITNAGTETCVIEKASSVCIDMLYGEYDMYSFYGRHAMERNIQKSKIIHGVQSIGSKRGTSSHQYNPSIIIADSKTNEDFGQCYGFCFIYSGNFKAEVELDQYNQTRVIMGLQDELFAHNLQSSEEFYTPEVVLSYSGTGLTKLSHNYHDIFRHNLCRGEFKTSPRPVLLNNWEATYFDFNGEKLYQIAKQASELGVEMFVLDDGWFGERNDDRSGLGDWYVNEEKLGGNLSQLVERINRLGMKFGIWVEPEMVNEDSDLFREHPDWVFIIPGRKPIRGRNQLVLDFSRKEVREYIYNSMCKILDSANIEYIKWDMNRSITDVYSAVNDKSNQGSVLHSYILGVYDVLERITKSYPKLLIEGCSGGGGRYDGGMLYYTPQIWCSDNTDAIDRIRIQEGTSFMYPISTVGSHVSAVPNHQTGRTTSLKTRGVVAMAGSFGYELDLNKLSSEEKEEVKQQITDYHKYWEVIHNGDYYRLTSTIEDKELAVWETVSKDKREALLNIITLNTHGNPITRYIRWKGLDSIAHYIREDTKEIYSGSALMNAGIPIPQVVDEYQSIQIYLKKL